MTWVSFWVDNDQPSWYPSPRGILSNGMILWPAKSPNICLITLKSIGIWQTDGGRDKQNSWSFWI